ncbi:MAG: HDOD domain-containing protein, partial [Chloroflexota bacterium]
RLRELISRLETLPSLPTLYSQLLGELESPDPSTTNLAQLVSQDMGMSVKILQLVNSAFFGLRQHIPSSTQAVLLLGLDTMKILGLSVQAFAHFDRAQLETLGLASLWNHSVSAATLARQIAHVEGGDRRLLDYAFTAGLLHDVGKLVLVTLLPAEYTQTWQRVVEQGEPLLATESELLGATHPQVGAYLLGLWGLPRPIVEAVAWHHHPPEHTADQFSLVTAVHVANVLACELAAAAPIRAGFDIDRGYLDRLGLADHLPVWREICREAAAKGVSHE